MFCPAARPAELRAAASGTPSTPRRMSVFRAFSFTDACADASWPWTAAAFATKWARALASSAFSSASTTERAFRRRCHSPPPSSLAWSAAHTAAESSERDASTNFRRSACGTAGRTPPGAVISSTSRASYSPVAVAATVAVTAAGAPKVGAAVGAGVAVTKAGAGAGAPQPPPARPGRCGAGAGPGAETSAPDGGWNPPPPPPPKAPAPWPPAALTL